MAKLKEYNGRYCEADFENAFLSFLEAEGWQYLAGSNIPRSSRRDVLYVDDLEPIRICSPKKSGRLRTPSVWSVGKVNLPRCTRCMAGW